MQCQWPRHASSVTHFKDLINVPECDADFDYDDGDDDDADDDGMGRDAWNELKEFTGAGSIISLAAARAPNTFSLAMHLRHLNATCHIYLSNFLSRT